MALRPIPRIVRRNPKIGKRVRAWTQVRRGEKRSVGSRLRFGQP